MRRYCYNFCVLQSYTNNKTIIMKITKLALIGLLFAAALFTTGCEKSPADDAAEATEEVTEAAE
jgi:hypothetical protein